jgi:hypothetical protein
MGDYFQQFIVHLLLNDTIGAGHCLQRAQAAEKELQKHDKAGALLASMKLIEQSLLK